MYYFWGAGNNCKSAIEFFGKEKIIAIVDNSSLQQGKELYGIPIIGFEEFLQKRKDEIVIITAFIASEQIAKQLENAGIREYFICPYMQSGFYNCNQIIEIWGLLKYRSIAFYDKNPVSELLIEEIQKRKKLDVYEITEEDWKRKELPEADLLLVIKENMADNDMQMSEKYGAVLNLYDAIRERRKKDYCYLEKYRGIHSGERCFLIGNGPSLTIEDLNKIYENGEKSFGCNQIYKIFEKAMWRPSYYVIGDGKVWEEVKNEFPSNSTCFIRNFMGEVDKRNDIEYYSSNGEKYYPGYPSFSNDLVQGVFGGRTVMYDMLQIAAYMGFKEIYLLGVDLSWGEDGKDTHFCKDYVNEELEKQIRENVKYKKEIEHAYMAARQFGEKHGIEIYNATRGGHLEIFKRADFDKIF